MRRLICLLGGHRPVRVRATRLVPSPGGILPMVDGIVVYEADPEGDGVACDRCRSILDHPHDPRIAEINKEN